MAKEEVHCTPKEPQGLIKTTLISQQGGLKIQEDCPFQAVPRSLLQLLIGFAEGFLRPLELETHPAGIADEAPGARARRSAIRSSP
ncbi:MAG TPA: hypothetical protein VLB76_24870 [Thermoanaerobaculia bacterium]|nr:hypothetical protein [Thermoanaerobaculia bacterium]